MKTAAAGKVDSEAAVDLKRKVGDTKGSIFVANRFVKSAVDKATESTAIAVAATESKDSDEVANDKACSANSFTSCFEPCEAEGAR